MVEMNDRSSSSREPQTPRRNRPNELASVHSEEVVDEDGNVHVHVTMPARLARDVDWSFQMSPRTPRTLASPPPTNQSTRPIIAPLQFNQEDANPALRRRAPPSPPPSPSPSPSPPPLLRVPIVAPPRGARRLNAQDPIYPRPANTWHALDPVPEHPTARRRFYVVTKGTKIGVFWTEWDEMLRISWDIEGGSLRRK